MKTVGMGGRVQWNENRVSLPDFVLHRIYQLATGQAPERWSNAEALREIARLLKKHTSVENVEAPK